MSWLAYVRVSHRVTRPRPLSIRGASPRIWPLIRRACRAEPPATSCFLPPPVFSSLSRPPPWRLSSTDLHDHSRRNHPRPEPLYLRQLATVRQRQHLVAKGRLPPPPAVPFCLRLPRPAIPLVSLRSIDDEGLSDERAVGWLRPTSVDDSAGSTNREDAGYRDVSTGPERADCAEWRQSLTAMGQQKLISAKSESGGRR
jgi:hypothetical protein